MTSSKPKSRRARMSSPRLPPVCPHALPSSSSSWPCRPAWSSSGLVAVGHRRLVVVVDGVKGVPAQVLDGHEADVTCVSWRLNCLELASGDNQGRIMVFDVVEGNVVSSLHLDTPATNGRQNTMLQWMDGRVDNSSHLLLALHNSSCLVLWDAFAAIPIWKFAFNETGGLHGFDVDPFDPTRVVLRGKKCLFFITDLSKQKMPSNVQKLFVSLSESFGHNRATREKATRIKSFVKELVANAKEARLGESEADSSDLHDCLEVLFHRSSRNHVTLLFPRDLLILDLDLEQTSGTICLSANASNMQQMLMTRLRDCIYTLQESGIVSFRHRHSFYSAVHPDLSRQPSSISSTPLSTVVPSNFDFPSGQVLEMVYETRAVSDAIRLGGKHVRVTGMAINPVTESEITLITSECRVYFLQLQNQQVIKHCSLALDNIIEGRSSSNLTPVRLFTRGLTSFLPSPPYVMRMCPPVTLKSLESYRPLLAVGSGSGNIVVVDLSHVAKVDREFAVHTFPVMGLEWASMRQVISFAHHQGLSASSLVRNELIVTDVKTGRSTVLRNGREDEPPIDKLRISHLKQYFILSFHGAPFELWDLRNGRLLRTMPKRFPPVTALEWSPLHNLKSLKKKAAQMAVANEEDNNKASDEVAKEAVVDESCLVVKEHFVFTDPEGQLYHFSVEGNAIRDGTKLPAEPTLGLVRSLTWKGDVVVRADIDGNVNVWNVRSRSSLNFSVGAPVKKMRFAPGKGNMKLLILSPDSVSLYNANQGQLLESSVNSQKARFMRPMDIDWAASDRPLIALEDGTLLVTSFELSKKHVSSPMEDFKWDSNASQCFRAMLNLKEKRRLEATIQNNEAGLEAALLELSKEDQSREESKQNLSRFIASLPSGLKSKIEKSKFSQLDRLVLISEFISSDPWHSDFFRVARASLDSTYSLDNCHDLMCHKSDFLASVEARIGLFESRLTNQIGNTSLRERVIDLKLLLDHKTDAMRLLIECEPQHNSQYYEDCLKACLISATLNSEKCDASHFSTVKLVATNLIAEGSVWRGVQLLCFIGRILDACGYLQADNMWHMATWLAKCRLSAKEYNKVLSKHCEHLINLGQRRSAALMYLAANDYVSTLETLLQMREIALAALLVQMTKEKGVMPDTSHALVLIEKTYLAYARYLYFECGLMKEALSFCDRADEKGEMLRREIEATQQKMKEAKM